MADINPKLNICPIQEALLEVRFESKKNYALTSGAIYEKLKGEYPDVEDLGPDLSVFPDFAGKVVQHRLKSESGKKMYQLGTGILSVNILEYEGFESFFEDIQQVLSVHKEYSGSETIKRIGLRYINKFIPDRDISKMFTIKFELPEPLKKIETGFNCRTLGQTNDDKMNIKFASEPLSKEKIMLDIEYFQEKEISYDLKTISDWVESSHKSIYESFKNCLTEEFFQYLSNA